MPRFARLHAPGALVHVIARFVNREHRLLGPAERAMFLERLPVALSRADWLLCAFALMSSHVHLALIAGHDPPSAWLRPLHVAVARALNGRQGRLGPAYAERATTIAMPTERMPVLVPYLHNNPVRAGLVADARDSDWTSHRAWIGEVAAPSWLAVDVGLAAAGFDATPEGRLAFDRLVRAQRGEPRDPRLSSFARARSAARAQVRLPVELSSPRQGADGASSVLLLHRGRPPTARWNGAVEALLPRVAELLRVSTEEVLSRRRARHVVRVRRVFATLVVVHLRRESAEAASALGLSRPAVSQLLRRAPEVLAVAAQVATELGIAGPGVWGGGEIAGE